MGENFLRGKQRPSCWLSLNCYDIEIGLAHLQSRNPWLHWRRCQGRQQKEFATLQECSTSCDRFVCNHWTWSSCKGDKLYQEEMALASSFKLAFQVSLTGCSYTYRLLNRNLYFQAGVPICRCPIYQYISDQGQPFLHILNSTARVDFYEKTTTFWKVQ